MQFVEGDKLPTTYAFALVEHRQQEKMRLRLYLTGEVKRFNTDEVEACPRLLSMLRIVSEVEKPFHILKVKCYNNKFYIYCQLVGAK